jgi:hypothetical protein
VKLLVVAVVCMGWSVAAAPAPPERIRLTYDAVASCPDREQLVALIAAHAQVIVVDDPGARGFAVSIVADADGLRGELSIAGAVRDVRGATCDEVVAAIALVAALAIEEQAPKPEPRVVTPVVPDPERRWRLAAGGGVGMFTGMAPTARMGAPIFLEAAREHGPQLRLAFDLTTRDDVIDDAGSTSFRWTAGRIDGCPFVWERGAFELAPCLGLELGVTNARGVDVAMAAASDRPWITPAAILRLGVRFGRATVAAEGSVGAPLVRDRFLIGPDVTVYQVPAIATNLALTLAIAIL